jgi:hypothetical protein
MSLMDDIGLDDHGFPVMLARPGPPVTAESTIETPTSSGNPSHGTASGRFGLRRKGKPKSEGRQNTVSSGVTVDELERREDAIRDAAREFHDMSEGDAQDFLAGRVRDLAQVDIAAFLRDVRAQRLDDLIDVLDQSLRRAVSSLKRSRRIVRVQAPKGWIRKTTNGLAEEEVRQIIDRLRARGWTAKDLETNFAKRMTNPSRREAVSNYIGVQPQ